MNSLKILSLIIMALSVSGYAKRDPTRPPGMSSFQSGEVIAERKLKLQGLVTGVSPWVVINDMVIKQGENKKGIKVITIKPEKVLVLYHQKKQWLKWQSIDIKNSAKKSFNK